MKLTSDFFIVTPLFYNIEFYILYSYSIKLIIYYQLINFQFVGKDILWQIKNVNNPHIFKYSEQNLLFFIFICITIKELIISLFNR